MNRFKKGIFSFMFLLFANGLMAQSVEEGKQFIYYERYQSAKEVLEKVVASSPSNDEAAYYLGQAEIGLENVPAARAVYLKALQTTPNSALLIAGMGHVELLEGKTADARNRFETAISLSKGKSIPVLNAIGLANANPDSKNGDANYAIAKLKQATEIKGFKDPEVLTNLGDAYRKIGDGGNAVQSYDAALAINPNYARALYRKGKVYQTQGATQEDLFMSLYNSAISKDPAYAPTYANLYAYFYSTNVPRSADYLNKWLQNSDDDPKACYYRASMKYAQGLFNDAIKTADDCIKSEGSNPYPNLYGIKALAYNRIGESLETKDSTEKKEMYMNAKNSYQEYFRRQSTDNIKSGDYAAYATILLKFPGQEVEAANMMNKAITMDGEENDRVSYVKSMAKAFEDQNNSYEAAVWYGKVMGIKKGFTNVDLFNAGYNFYVANAMDSSNRYFTIYTDMYPNDILGYYMLGNAYSVIDSTGELGLAVPYYNKVIEIGESDTTKPNVKTRLINAYKYFVGYNFNVKKDSEAALMYVDKGLAFAPTDEQLLYFKEFITKNKSKASQK